MRTKCLVLFAESLSGPEVSWSLLGSNIDVVALHRIHQRPAIRYDSRVRCIAVPAPESKYGECVAAVGRIIDEVSPEVILPIDDTAIAVVSHCSETVRATVAGPTGDRLRVALDKRLQLQVAAEAGFHVPSWYEVRRDADSEAQEMGFPVVLKPALAIEVVGSRIVRDQMYYCLSEEQLRGRVESEMVQSPYYVQQVISGTGIGLFGIARHGDVTAWSAHERLRMMNPAGSGASACTSRIPSTDSVNMAVRFVQLCKWSGLFMIELMRDAHGKEWFIEFNGRAWGSMALARRRGYEYPAWAVQSALEVPLWPKIPVDPPACVCRHLGREILHLAFVFRGNRQSAPDGWPGRWHALREVVSWKKGESWYNYSPDARRVFWADAVETVRQKMLS